MQELKAYHATKSSKIRNIIEEEFKPSISTDPKEHWLGKGIYFYEDLYYAVEWCYLKLNEANRDYDTLKEKCGIISVKIDVENFTILDLNTGLGYDVYRKIVKSIEELCNEEEKQKIKNDGDIKTIRIIERIEERLGKKLFSSFDVIYAIYPKNIFKKNNTHKGDFFVGMQRQLCVKNQKAIVSKQRYNINGEDVEKIYKLIIENRGKIE